MAKKKEEKPKREMTKRHLSLWEQQKKRRRIALVVGITVIAAVLGIVVAGWYINQYKPLHQKVIKVNDTEFNMDYYIKTLKIYAAGMSSSYLPFWAEQVVAIIETDELVKQEAAKLGITVSDEAVDEELKSSDPPLNNDYRDLVGADLLREKLLAEYFDPQVPVSDEERYVMAMFLESAGQAAEVKARLEAGEDFAELAEELSLESTSKEKKGDFGWRPKDALAALLGTSLLDEYAFGAGVGEISQPIYDESGSKQVGYWLAKISERKEDTGEIHVHAMLLGSAEEAQSVKARIEAGEDFAELAVELSQYETSKSNRGDLGLLPEDMIPAIDEFVRGPELELEKLSEPIRDDTMVTTGGYWLVKVTDIEENRTIEEENRDLLKAKLLDEWMASLSENPKNTIDHSYLTDDLKMRAMQKAVEVTSD